MGMAMDAWALVAAAMAVVGGAVVVTEVVRCANEWWVERRLDGERRRRLPPGHMGWPMIGTMWAFLRAFKSGDPDSFVASFAKRYGKTGVYKTFMFGNPTILATAPETCKQIIMDDVGFIPGWPKAACELVGRRSFISIIHDEHKRLRRLTAAPINGYDALSTYLGFIEKTVRETLRSWEGNGEMELLTGLRKLTFRVIMHIFLSSESDSIMEELEKVYTQFNHGIRAMAINLPGFAFHRALKARRRLVSVLQKVLDGRRSMKRGKQPNEGKDMMDALMEVEDENGRGLDDEQILDLLIMYLNAGHESSGHMTMWVTLLLQENPECFRLAKLEQEEIRRKKPPTQEGLTLKEVRQMQYLSKVIDEALRLVNISFVAFREATTDVEINGYIIPKGWKVQLWYRNLHMDPEFYADPKKFNPSRWDGFTPKAGTFLPFGGGSRLCPGNELAKLEIYVFLHYFLLDYKMERVNPQGPMTYLPHPRPTDNCMARITRI